jgi:hypothetical protein
MEPRSSYTFDGFRLEPPPGGLWRGDARIALRPRPLAMLRYLVAHAGRLVTKAELRQHVWGGTPQLTAFKAYQSSQPHHWPMAVLRVLPYDNNTDAAVMAGEARWNGYIVTIPLTWPFIV